MVARNTEETLWSRCIPEPNTGCWLWLGRVDVDGYGDFKFRGRPGRAHRHAWEFTNGPIPKGLFVCHKCDVPSCINPGHLFLGTAAENNRDRHRKGRSAVGENSGPRKHRDRMARGEQVNTSKLTAEQVVEARRMFDAGTHDRMQLAKMYGTSWTAMNRLVKRLHWKHIP